MPVKGINHVNIVTADVDATARFFGELLGLERGPTRGAPPGHPGAWLSDAEGHPIIHLMKFDPDSAMSRDNRPGDPTGAVHHVALTCTGYADIRARADAMGCDYAVNEVERLGLRQIVLADPNAVRIELNFAGD